VEFGRHERNVAIEKLVARMRISSLLGLSLATLGLAGAGGPLVLFAGWRLDLQLAGLLCLATAVALANHLWRVGYSRPALTLDPDAIDSALYGRVPWPEVRAMSLSRFKNQASLNLYVREPGRYLGRYWVGRYLVGEARRKAPIGMLSIPLGSLNQDPELLHTTARLLRGAFEPPLPRFWLPNMSEEGIDRSVATEQGLDRMQSLMAKAEGDLSMDKVQGEFDRVHGDVRRLQSERIEPLPIPEMTPREKRGWLLFVVALAVLFLAAIVLRGAVA
jgi:hypothetical protein